MFKNKDKNKNRKKSFKTTRIKFRKLKKYNKN